MAQRRSGWEELRAEVLAMDPLALGKLERMLPPADLLMIRQILDESTENGWRSSPAAMAHHLSDPVIDENGDSKPGYELWPHIQLLGKKFAGSVTGSEPAHQIWNLPSQYGKTSLMGVWGPVWALDRNPKLRIMFVSYDADKAVNEAGEARDIAERHADRLRFRLRPDRRARGLWRTDQGGGLYATGVRGAITGFPADMLLLDDLLKGWIAAHSEAERELVWNVWRSQLRMRMQSPTSPIIVSGTRWHEDDYFAKLIKQGEEDPHADQFEVTKLPALAVEGDLLGREVGEPLAPARFSRSEVLTRKATLGSYLFQALEQQDPSPEEGGEIKRAWWKRSASLPPKFDDVASSWDLKLKDKEAGDYCVGQVWGRTGSTFWLIDQVRGQWPQAATRVGVALMLVRHPEIRRHFIENAGYGPEVMKELREAAPEYRLSDDMADMVGVTQHERPLVEAVLHRGVGAILPVIPKGPKPVRVRAISGKIEAGNVVLPEGKDFAEQLISEAAAFPRGSHDDAVDAMSQALSQMSGSAATAQPARGAVARSPRRTWRTTGLDRR